MTPAIGTATALRVRPVAGTLGAEITGVRLGPDLPGEQVAEIRAALLTHKVVFLPGQDHLDDDAHTGFARRLGPLTAAFPLAFPTVAAGEKAGEHATVVLPVDAESGHRANRWHTDVSFVDRPPSFSVLRALVLPPFGGDTVFADTAAAYAGLPPALRALADRLWAEHANRPDAGNPGAAPGFRTRHPVVHAHPETGERALLLGVFVTRLLGVDRAESDALLTLLHNRVTRLENTVRHRWAPGDVVIWDNRATQHYAVADYGSAPRRMRRVTVAGAAPVSVEGRRSVVVEGDSDAYVAGRGQ
jgi:alpha-ketoglutarate-dependent sulfate ester dioxygenase